MKKETIGTLIIVLIVIIAGVYLLRRPLMPKPDTGNGTASTTDVAYFCQEGTIAASYGTASVNLHLSDGRVLDLPQAMSGSGVRYEKDTAVFWSKGNNAFLEEGGKTTFSNCVAGTQTQSGNNNTFTDASKTFSFAYPNMFSLYGGDGSYAADWRAQTTDLGLLLAAVQVPRSYQPATNFSEAKFTVGTSSDPKAVASCLTEENMNPGAAISTVLINGNTFTKISMSDAGAGNFYDTTSYRAVRNGQCYVVEYTIHSTNIGNYSPDQHISQFDKVKVQGVLENMVQSFKFI